MLFWVGHIRGGGVLQLIDRLEAREVLEGLASQGFGFQGLGSGVGNAGSDDDDDDNL